MKKRYHYLGNYGGANRMKKDGFAIGVFLGGFTAAAVMMVCVVLPLSVTHGAFRRDVIQSQEYVDYLREAEALEEKLEKIEKIERGGR